MNNIKLLAESGIDSVMNNGMNFGERLLDGGRMILVLMAFVFSVIFLIFLSQTIISSVIVAIQNKGKKSKKNENVEIQTVVPIPEVDEATADNEDEVTVAVITAALAAYLAENSEDGTVLPFRVVSFSRKKSGKPWNSKF